MMKLQKFITTSYLALLGLGFHSNAYASQEDCPQDTIDRLLKHARNAIESVESEKIRLHTEKVDLHNNEVYVEGENGEAILLPSAKPFLFYDDSGLYLYTAARESRKVFYICTKCTATQTIELNGSKPPPTQCLRCLNPTFYIRYQ